MSFTDADLGLGDSSQGFTDDELMPKPFMQRMADYDRQFTGAVIQGAGEGVATALRGAGAGVESGPAGEGRALQTAIEAIQGGQDPSEAIETARTFGPRFQDVRQQPLYQAGERVSEFFKDERFASPDLHPFVRDIGSGAGSLLANIGVGMVPGAGPAALIGFGTMQGRGEAVERAVKAGATPEQQVQAAQLGAGPGLTDFVDLALARTGMAGAAHSRLRRALNRLVLGGAVEGSQEGIQQFLQNAIAQNVYKPEQDLTEDVLYNALLGFIVGGGAKVVLGGQQQPAQTPPSAGDVQWTVDSMTAGVPSPPPGGVVPTPAPVPNLPPDIPSATGPEEFGLQGRPAEPTRPVSPNDPVDAAMGTIAGFQQPPQEPPVTPDVPRTIVSTGPGRARAVPASSVDPAVSAFLAKKTGPLTVGEALPQAEGTGELQNDLGSHRIDQFIDRATERGRANEWIEVPEGRMYLRFNRNIENGRLDISNLDFETRGTGAFTRYLDIMEARLRSDPDLRVIFVENIMNPRLEQFLIRRGYTVSGETGAPSARLTKTEAHDVKFRQLNPPIQREEQPRFGIRRMLAALKPSKEEIEARPGVDAVRMAKLLGPKLYGSPADITTTSIKEIVQNGFDAIKTMLARGQIQKGRIDILMDDQSRTLTISDNGSGMSPEILSTKFLEIAGTKKESERASGGLGIAKMLFLFGNQNLEVITLRDNKVSTLNATGPQLFEALGGGAAPKVNVRAPTRQDRTLFPEGHGTVVRVKIPEEYTDPATGEARPIRFDSWSPRSHDVLSRSPLFDNIDVTFNGQPVEGMGSAFPLDQYTQFANVNSDWGTARIYVQKEQDPNIWGSNAHVLSNGLWQFSFKIPKDPGDPYSEPIPRTFFIDVNSKVKPEEAGYPFDLNRQQFSPQAKKSFAQIFQYISMAYAKLDFVESMNNFGDIQYLTGDENGVFASEKQKLAPKVPPSATAASAVNAGDQVSIVDGKLIVNGRTIPELRPEDLKNFSVDPDELKIPQEEINPNLPILHDNVDVKISDSQVVSISELMREQFGMRFDEFAQQMGNAFIDLRDVVAEISPGKKTIPNPKATGVRRWTEPAEIEVDEKPWTDLKKEGIGVSFDNQYRGVSIRVPFSASFLNIAVPEFTDTIRAAVGMVGTMVHELAHHRVRNHNAEFPAEMQRIYLHLRAHPTWDHPAFEQRVVDIVNRYRDVFEYLNGVMTNGTFPVQPRGKRFDGDDSYEAGDGSPAGNLGENGPGARSAAVIFGRIARGPTAPSSQSGSEQFSVSVQASGPDPLKVQAQDQRRLDSEANTGSGETATGRPWSGSGGPDAQFRQPEVDTIRKRLGPLFQGTGGTPPAIQQAASHADRMNRWYKWMAGLDQLLKANPMFMPLRKYFSAVQQMHNEETKIQDAALRVAKRWRRLGDQGDRLSQLFDDLANMRYRTADEVRRGIERHPSVPEFQALLAKHRIDAEGLKVYNQVRQMFNWFIEATKDNAFAAAQRIITDQTRLAAKLNEIQAHIDHMKSKPYFPLMRFGVHYIMKKDAANRVIHFETFERVGWRSAESLQTEGLRKLKASALPGEKVTQGILPEIASPFLAMPSTLLETIKQQLSLTPDQINALEHIQLMQSSALNFKRMMKNDYIPGYSLDFKRAFAKYFFHGARHYARTKYGNQINSHITEAAHVPSNKANLIANYMRDHYQNTILDAKGDFGIFKAGIFLWALGYLPAAATMNLLQTPTVTLSHLAGKFGGLGLGNKRATQAVLKAALDVKNTYRKREAYDGMTGFKYEAISYGIKTGRISETQAPELAGLSAANNLNSVFGTRLQQGWMSFMEKSAFLFEMAEQFNRRVAFRAALDLATKFPNSKAVREATQLYSAEFQALQTAATGRRAFTPAEAAAIVTAVHTVDQTQFIYGRYARPRFMRGRVAGTVFVFKKYLQSMLFWLGQNKSDALPQYMLMMALLGGLGGLPGFEDLRDLIKGIAKQLFGKDFNIEKKTRELVTSLFDDRVPPDLILHGLARVGFGVPALLDMMGGLGTGLPGRGLQTSISHLPSDPTGRGQNVPFPVLDRHRALSMGSLTGFSIGNMIAAQGDRETQKAIAEETQKASGAVFGLGFNLYKFLASEGSWSDMKEWERIVPRSLGALSRAYRAFDEGRERGRGGPNAAPTIVPYDARDPEQMMEMIFMAAGYQTLRQQARWDNIIAKADAERFWDGRQKGLLAQYDEARMGQNAQEIERVTKAIQDFNQELPDFARGMVISVQTLENSMKQRQRVRSLRELGLPTQKRHFGISQHIDQLYREGAVDVRPVR